MAKIFDGPWKPPATPYRADPEPPEMQLQEAMRLAGMNPPSKIVMDGKIHRFDSTKKKGKTGWYVVFDDGIPAGRFGCWRDGIESTFRADVGRKLTIAEQMAHTRRMAEAKAIREKELEKERESASDVCEKIWTSAMLASAEHPYLKRKGIDSHGARVTGDGRLIVPLVDMSGEFSSLQYIDQNGGKLYHKGGSTGGKFWVIGVPEKGERVYLAEGFATAATIYQSTNRPVVVCYSASNLVPVLGQWREHFGETQEFVIVADNDKSGTGQKYADQAAAKHGARVIIPPEEGDANDFAKAGGDLKQFLEPPVSSDWLMPADDFCQQPAPLSWLVKHWLQDNALIMVHGPSGCGKTFTVLDWCCRVAGGFDNWQGHKVKGGAVVYLAGEGHHGLRGRIAAWKVHNGSTSLKMWLSKDGCDLNTNEGYTRAKENISALPQRPKVIVVDTLHRFLSGDENSAQDAKGMLDACNALMMEFGCSVLLVHHTGVSEEAQHRARGSSAWKGALDIEISITPNKTGGMTIRQMKAKDSEQAEDVFAELNSVQIPGWFDEDGDPVSSAVLVEGVEPSKEQRDTAEVRFTRDLEAAWFSSGAEVQDGKPYISKSALASWLESHKGLKENTIKNHLKPSDNAKTVGCLMNAKIIEKHLHGWVVVDNNIASAMMIKRNSE